MLEGVIMKRLGTKAVKRPLEPVVYLLEPVLMSNITEICKYRVINIVL